MSDGEPTLEPAGERGARPAADAGRRDERLAEENRRLRLENRNDRRTGFRRAALGFAVVGLAAAVVAVPFETSRDVLFALAGTGLFAAVLTYYLVPDRVISEETGERVYAPLADTLAAITAELGLRDERLYVPTGEDTAPVRLFIPAESDPELPPPRAGPIVTEDGGRGLVLQPTGGTLVREFRYAVPDGVATEPERLGSQLADGLVERFELTDSAEPDVEAADGRATVGITGSSFGDVDRLDHPIASFLACGFAVGLDRTVSLEVSEGGSRYDWLVTCRWEAGT